MKFLGVALLTAVLWVGVCMLVTGEMSKPLATIGSMLESIGLGALITGLVIFTMVVIDWQANEMKQWEEDRKKWNEGIKKQRGNP